MPDFIRLIISILLTESAGILGAIFTTSNIPTWYVNLNKPGFTPPSWIFGPVWTLLYLLMGLSFYLIWRTKATIQKRKGLKYFTAQLVLNVLWSLVFFGMHSPLGGLIIIVVLWIFILQTIRKFYNINRVAAYLLYPYLAWVSFASLLNLAIVMLNP